MRVSLQIVDIGCPGGRIGKAEESTTRRPVTPYTLALLSSTAIESVFGPIAPKKNCQSSTSEKERDKDLQVQAAWKTVEKEPWMYASISSSVWTVGPGAISPPRRAP